MRYCDGPHAVQAVWRNKVKKNHSTGQTTEAWCDDCKRRIMVEPSDYNESDFEQIAPITGVDDAK